MTALSQYLPVQRKITAEEAEKAQKLIYNSFMTQNKGTPFMRNSSTAEFAEFFVREISYIWTRLLLTKYSPIKYREVLKVISEGGFNNTIITQMYNAATGEQDTVEGLSGDGGEIQISAKEQSSRVIQLRKTLKYEYAEMEVMKGNGRIPEAKLKFLRRAFDEWLDNLAYFGNARANKTGLLTDTNIIRVTAANGASGSSLWSTKTAQEKLRDVLAAYNLLNTNSNDVFNCNTIALSNTSYRQLVGTPRSDLSDTTIDKFALDNLPTLETMFGVSAFNGQGVAVGGNPSNIMVIMDKQEENAFFNIPVEMMPLPVQYDGSLIKMPFISRSSGFTLNYAPSIIIVEGI